MRTAEPSPALMQERDRPIAGVADAPMWRWDADAHRALTAGRPALVTAPTRADCTGPASDAAGSGSGKCAARGLPSPGPACKLGGGRSGAGASGSGAGGAGGVAGELGGARGGAPLAGDPAAAAGSVPEPARARMPSARARASMGAPRAAGGRLAPVPRAIVQRSEPVTLDVQALSEDQRAVLAALAARQAAHEGRDWRAGLPAADLRRGASRVDGYQVPDPRGGFAELPVRQQMLRAARWLRSLRVQVSCRACCP